MGRAILREISPSSSVANPKFAIPRGNSESEFRIQSHTSNLLILVWFEFEVPKRGCHENLGNFKSTTRAFRMLNEHVLHGLGTAARITGAYDAHVFRARFS